ncbi:MAG: ATP-binding protein [Gammaproteobacteria bacterium]
MLSQIIINLLSNAIKFTEKGTITLDCQDNENNLVIRVIDSGIGISPGSLEEIFEAFKQVDSSTTRKYQGTGLGLSISQHFSLMLGGKLDVESQVGTGSTFTLTLPIKQ